jgi:hypothetical protein
VNSACTAVKTGIPQLLIYIAELHQVLAIAKGADPRSIVPSFGYNSTLHKLAGSLAPSTYSTKYIEPTMSQYAGHLLQALKDCES